MEVSLRVRGGWGGVDVITTGGCTRRHPAVGGDLDFPRSPTLPRLREATVCIYMLTMFPRVVLPSTQAPPGVGFEPSHPAQGTKHEAQS
jgi:hypothetical protein